jgi:hypothetical protein
MLLIRDLKRMSDKHFAPLFGFLLYFDYNGMYVPIGGITPKMMNGIKKEMNDYRHKFSSGPEE